MTACIRCGGTGEEVDHVEIGNYYRLWRKEMGLTLADISRRTGWSTAFISDLERGRRSWNSNHRSRIEEAIRA